MKCCFHHGVKSLLQEQRKNVHEKQMNTNEKCIGVIFYCDQKHTHTQKQKNTKQIEGGCRGEMWWELVLAALLQKAPLM